MKSGIVSTIGQRCKRCYSCIRECPAIAIRVENGQAVVIADRCISCGHCVKVCSQNAKKVVSDVDRLVEAILPINKTIAIIAPAFAASFPDNYMKLPTALRKLGFDQVMETAFGADLVSNLYLKKFEHSDKKTIISSPCPAIYNYLEKYFVDLVPKIAQIVSPMIAMGRYLKMNMGEKVKVVFIGPCIAKKSEYTDEEVIGAIDAVLTFTELKKLLKEKQINIDDLEESYFDPPYSYMGKSYSLSGGLLKTAGMSNDVLAKDVIIVDGKEKVEAIIHDIADGKINSKFIDILFCEGCINGPGIDSDLNYYSKREKVIEYIDRTLQHTDKNVWKSQIYNARNLDLTRTFSPHLQRKPMPSDELNCGACGYPTCREYAIAIGKDLAEDDMCLPYVIDKMEKAYIELRDTQIQLHSAEKLASIGQLAAGVAHEMNNPLGTILLYSSILKKEIINHKDVKRTQEDLEMIIEEAKRCKNIVTNLLDFARQGKLQVSKVDVLEIIEEVIRTIHIRPEFSDIRIVKNLQSDIANDIEGDEDQIKQILINIIVNACESMEESTEKQLTIDLSTDRNYLVIKIIDSGCGIPEENLKKLFTPFFTTKKMGKGTGLGLAITYGIVKMHKGDIKVESSVGEGSKFIIRLPNSLTVKKTENIYEAKNEA